MRYVSEGARGVLMLVGGWSFLVTIEGTGREMRFSILDAFWDLDLCDIPFAKSISERARWKKEGRDSCRSSAS